MARNRMEPMNFAARVAGFQANNDPNACWVWPGCTNGFGYGMVGLPVNGKTHRFPAHREVFKILVGPIPAGLDLDHLCRNRRCVNPSHLEPVTRQVNIRRGVAPTAIIWRTNICKRGHVLSPENVILQPKRGRFYRRCRTCYVAHQQTVVNKRDRREYMREYNRKRRKDPLAPMLGEATVCRWGHPWSGDNLRIDRTRKGKKWRRRCLACQRRRSTDYRQRKAQKTA